MNLKISPILAAALCGLLSLSTPAHGQGTAFTYQGRLNSGNAAANGSFDVQFTLYATNSGGSSVAGPLVSSNIVVTNGLFTTTVDFGGVFNGPSYWLELAVRTNGGLTFSPALTPRQQLTPTPYSVYAESANASNLVGTIPSGTLSGVALLSGGNTFLGQQNIYGNIGINTSTPATQFANTANNIYGTDGYGLGSQSLGWYGAGFGYTAGFFTPGGGTAADGVVIGIGGTTARVLDLISGGNKSVMVVNGNGTVGIGTTSPDRPLAITGVGVNGEWLSLKATNGATQWHLNNDANGLNFAQTAVADGRLFLSTNGNAGFGTITPETTLQVGSYSSHDNYLTLSTGGGNLYRAGIEMRHFNNSLGWTLVSDERDNSFQLRSHVSDTNGLPRIRVDRFSGNVGIGLTNAVAPLSVTGTATMPNDFGTMAPGIHMGGIAGYPGQVGLVIAGAPTSGNASVLAFSDGSPGVWGAMIYSAASSSFSFNENGIFSGELTCTAVNITSDRNAKEKFKPVNPREVLDKVAHLPISEWQYKTQGDARHIGPMAQDFRAAFALGHDDKHITSVDEDGVALAAIQGLNEKLDEKDARIQQLEDTVNELKALVNKLAAQKNGGAK